MSAELIVSIVFNVILLLFSIYTFVRRHKRKSFSYAIYETPVYSIHEKIDGLALTYHGKLVVDLRVVLVKVWNSGEAEINDEDFDIPINFCEDRVRTGLSFIDPKIIEYPE
jgi:hypothetical protein